jgi:hypothetical protein
MEIKAPSFHFIPKENIFTLYPNQLSNTPLFFLPPPSHPHCIPSSGPKACEQQTLPLQTRQEERNIYHFSGLKHPDELDFFGRVFTYYSFQ